MLTKITDDLFIDLDRVFYAIKVGKDIEIKMEGCQINGKFSVYTKEGKGLIKVLNERHLMSMERKDD